MVNLISWKKSTTPYSLMDNYDLYAEHNQIWFLDYKEVKYKKDIKRLEELGWFKDEDVWSCYI